MNPHTYSQLIFDKVAKIIQWIKDSIFNKWCWLAWRSACGRMQINQFFTSLYKPQVQVDQESPHKTRYTESIKKESLEEP